MNTTAFPTGTARETAQLCAKCQPIFHQPLEFDEQNNPRYFEHHEDLMAFQSSADRGCSLCAQFLRGFDGISGDDTGLKTGQVRLSISWPEDCRALNLKIPHRSGVSEVLTYRVWLRPTFNQGTFPTRPHTWWPYEF